MKTLHTIYNNFAKRNLASLRLLFITLLTLTVIINAQAETIASWGCISISANTNYKAIDGDANNKNVAQFSSSKAMTTSGTNAYYGSSAGGAVITFSNLDLSNYTDVMIYFYSRASQAGYFSLSYSTDGTSFDSGNSSGTLATKNTPTQYSIALPSNSEDITTLKLSHSKSSGSLYFGTVTITGTKKAAVSYTITPQSNNTSYGTVSLSGTTITATPNAGYRVKSGDAGFSIAAGSATVINNGDNTFSVTPSTDCTITINFEVIPTFTVNWYVNGIRTYSQTDVAGTALTNIPNLEDYECEDKVFVGWTTQSSYEHATNAPTGMITNTFGITMPEGGENYYAVFATSSNDEGNGAGEVFYINEGSTGTHQTTAIVASGNINTKNGNGDSGNCIGLTSAAYKTFTFSNINTSNYSTVSLQFDHKIGKYTNYPTLTISCGNFEKTIQGSTGKYITATYDDFPIGTNLTLTFTISAASGSNYSQTYLDNISLIGYKATTTYFNYTTQCTTETTVTLQPNGGTGTAKVLETTDGSLMLPECDFTYEGYRFVGWNTKANGTGTTYQPSAKYTPIENPATLYAKWAKEYSVTYNANGGITTCEDNNKYIAGEQVTVCTSTPTRDGYNFSVWSYSPTVTVTSGTFTMPESNVTITAQWTAIEYTITYNDTKGATNSNPTTYTIEDEISFAALTDLPKGYNFTGWDHASIAKGTTGNQTVTAQWTEKALTRYRTDCDACIPLDGYAEINGTYHFFPGETITLTVTPPADAVPYTYQWQKLVGSAWTDIAGATTTTYTKDETTIADAGRYRCVVSSEGYCDAIAEYDVKCLQLYVYYDNKSDVFNAPLNKANATTATISVDLQNANYKYYFKITDGCGNWYGYNGDIHSGWCTNVPMNADAYCSLQTTKFGTYVFNVNYSDLAHLTVSVIYPAAYQAADKVIYLDNNVLNWTNSNNAEGKNKIYYRIGRSNHNSKTAMTKVPGTANLYKVTTDEYDNFDVWHIANNGCWSDGNSIYKTNTGDDWAATQATAFETLPVTSNVVTVTPTDLRSKGGDDNNNNCDFYNYDITEGMKTWNAEVIEPTNGTITVKYTHHDGTAVNNFTSGDRDLAHTCLLTITAKPNVGYSLTSLTVNDVPFTSGNIHTLTADAVIKATFTINNYNVTWKLNGGNISSDESDIVQTYQYGAAIEAPENPTFDCYEFVGWTPTYNAEMTMPAEDLVFTAKWNKLSYTITFKNYDGTVLQTSTVECGETPSYTGAMPTREKDVMYEYEFAGWDPTVAEATEDKTYTATYNQTKRQYTVTWFVDGKQIDSKSVAAGDLATAPEVNPIPCGAVLAGWTDAENGVYEHGTSSLYEGAQPSIEITDNKTFYAVFADRETIIPKLPENIVYWENQKITADLGITATIGDGTMTSNVTLADSRDRTYYGSISTAAQISLENLNLRDYNNINLSFWARGSAKGTFTIVTDVDNNPIGTVTLTGDERLYIIENIPSDATSITLTYSASSGSLFFGTVKIYENTSADGTFTKLTAENTNGWTGSDWDGYYLITNDQNTLLALDGNAIGEKSYQVVAANDGVIASPIKTAFLVSYDEDEQGYSIKGIGDELYLGTANNSVSVSKEPIYHETIGYNQLKNSDKILSWNNSGSKFGFYGLIQTSAPQMYKIMSELSNYRTLCVYDIKYTNTFDVAHTNPENYTVATLPLTFSAPTSTREGYTFAGWSPASLDENTRGDQVVEAQWTANTNTPYVVKHYKEQLDGTYPTEADDTDNLTGTTATSVTPEVKSYEGFTAPSTQTVSIAADGSTVVIYQYTRNSYNLSWNVNEGDALTGEYTSGNVKYETAITQPNTPTRTGYTFIGWSPAEIPATMPANDLAFTAQWEALPVYAINWTVNGAPADGEPTTSVFEGQYITTLPTTPDVDCNGKVFVGWTTAEIDGETPDKPSLLYKELSDFPAITNDFTFYAVFAKGEGDNKWIETSIDKIGDTDEVVVTMTNGVTTWALNKTLSEYNYPLAPVVEGIDGVELPSTEVATEIIWNIGGNSTDGYVFYPKGQTAEWLYCTKSGNVKVGKTNTNRFTIVNGFLKHTNLEALWEGYLAVSSATIPDWRMYQRTQGVVANKEQTLKFYKKTIVYTSYTNYSTSCVAGEFDITNTDPIYVTSAVGQKVKAHDKLVLTATDMTVGTEISLSAPNITFYKEGIEITQLTTESAEETFELEIAYQPTAENTIEQPTITLDILGHQFTFNGRISARSLPETFAVVAKVGNVWYALPSQGLTSETIPVGCPIEVDNNDNPTTVTAVPANADWSLRQVSSSGANDRYTANGANLVFVNAENKTLYASNSNANIQTYAEYSNYAATNPERYEWLPTTTDLTNYTLKNVGRAKDLSINTNATFGTHASNVASSNIRFLPIQNRYTPAALQVVEWKENSVVVMYNGNPEQTASVSVNGGTAEETILSSEQRDIAVYELAATGLAANPTQRLSITIGTEKVILSIPYIINSETTDEAVLPGSSVAARQEVAKVSDMVILKGATLTAAGAGGNPYKFRNVTVYGGGNLVVPAEKGFGVNSLTLRAGGVTADGDDYVYDYVYPQFVLNGTWTNTSGKINLDYLTTKEQYYTFVAPFAVNTKDIKYPVDIYGNNVDAANKGSFEFEYYDGATRATGVTGWKTVEEGAGGATLEPGQGYTFLGMPKKVSVNGGSSTRQKFGIHRIPMTVRAEDAMTHENSAQTITVAPHPAEKNINSGWNLIGNPYMSTITGLDNQSIKTGTIVWEDNKWEWSTDETYNQRFIVFPSNDGQWYTTAQASNATLPAFKNFFVQIANDANALVIPYTSRTNPSAAPARHAAEEIDRDIELAIVLEKDEQNADQMDFLLNNTYGPAFDRNADFTKMMNNTNFNLYGVHFDDCLSFVAIDQYTAAQPVAIGYQVPTAGEYMLRMSDKPYVMADRIKALYVTDHEMTPEVTTDILKEPYRFTVGKAETNHTRFTISIELKPNTGDGVTTGWENVDVGKDQPIKFIYQDKLYILRNGVIYDATGKFVQTINK